MPTLDLEAEYNNRKRVPNYAEIQGPWSKASDEYRRTAKVELDLAYGKGPRHKFDLYRARTGGDSAPVAIFIHGGYWQRGDRKDSGINARELNAKGVTVAMPSYTLCPDITVMGIVEEMRQCVKAVWEKTKQRPVVVGHSAGGHLAAAMLATDWSKAGGVPADVVKCAYAISGVFDVAPLVPTSLNDALKLDEAAARAVSPILWSPPPKTATLVAAVGGDESQEFVRQSLEVASVWGKAGVKAECVVVPSANHFTVLADLMNGESAMVARIAAMARS